MDFSWGSRSGFVSGSTGCKDSGFTVGTCLGGTSGFTCNGTGFTFGGSGFTSEGAGFTSDGTGFTSGDTGFMKPHPAIYWRMLGLLNSTPDRAIFVGDSPRNDIAGANKTGLVSVHVKPPHLNKLPELPIEHADYSITTLSELLPLLEKLNMA